MKMASSHTCEPMLLLLSPESIADARMYIETNLGDKYMTNAPRIYSSSENAQEAHEAIRPTNASTKSERFNIFLR